MPRARVVEPQLLRSKTTASTGKNCQPGRKARSAENPRHEAQSGGDSKDDGEHETDGGTMSFGRFYALGNAVFGQYHCSKIYCHNQSNRSEKCPIMAF
jgi:hypothetical protein